MQKQRRTGLAWSCGRARGMVFDSRRPAWQEDGPRPVQWSAWYPVSEGSIAADHPAAGTDFFEPGAILPDAAPVGGAAKAVILLSHGTGGTADSIGWMARLLATRGCMVIAANHHGSTGMEAYCPEGFLCWWERATDLSFLLDHFAADHRFGPMLAQAPVKVIGYSLGAHTALALMGGVTSMSQFQDFGLDHPAMVRGPREVPDLGERLEGLFETSPAFRESWAQHGQSFRDARVCAAVLLAPPPPVRAFTQASLASIAQPVSILVSTRDREADAEVCAGWL